jgi:hypothetical protein
MSELYADHVLYYGHYICHNGLDKKLGWEKQEMNTTFSQEKLLESSHSRDDVMRKKYSN